MEDVLFTMGVPLFYVHSAFRQMVALSELLALISIAFGFLLKHNSEYTTQNTTQNKILIWYSNTVRKYGKKEAGTGEHLTHFNNKINQHKWKAAAPHGRLPHTKHKLKFQAWSSLVFHCRHSSFNPSEAPPWASRPVSGAGVVHYHLLHRPRSVPTASRPAPLATYPHRPPQAGGYPRDCALLPPPPPPLSQGEPVIFVSGSVRVR